MNADSRSIVKICCKNLMAMPYHINITDNQRAILRLIFPGACARLRNHDPFDIPEAIFFIVYTGCQWSRLPMGYPPYKTV
ncbi:MAG: transposase, partial [Muribaculaceae bacterium]|nr:transposase [Muribaculaceae bacterium]